jgi:hypothetical protein
MASSITVTTATVILGAGYTTSIGILCVILLIGFLTSKELLNASGGERQKLLARSLNIGIIPLLISFLVIVCLKVVEILT